MNLAWIGYRLLLFYDIEHVARWWSWLDNDDKVEADDETSLRHF